MPNCCNGNNYQLVNTGNGNWDLYFNDLSTPLKTVNTNYDIADTYFSGGETDSTASGMGTSGNINVQIINPDGQWVDATDWQEEGANAEYHLARLGPASWQVYGGP